MSDGEEKRPLSVSLLQILKENPHPRVQSMYRFGPYTRKFLKLIKNGTASVIVDHHVNAADQFVQISLCELIEEEPRTWASHVSFWICTREIPDSTTLQYTGYMYRPAYHIKKRERSFFDECANKIMVSVTIQKCLLTHRWSTIKIVGINDPTVYILIKCS